MSQDTQQEFRVGREDGTKRVMYFIKERLLKNETIDVVSGTAGALAAASAAETLVRLKYVTYVDIKTETNIVEGNRRTKFSIKLKKTNQFQSLYDENEKVRSEKQAQRTNNNNSEQDNSNTKTDSKSNVVNTNKTGRNTNNK